MGIFGSILNAFSTAIRIIIPQRQREIETEFIPKSNDEKEIIDLSHFSTFEVPSIEINHYYEGKGLKKIWNRVTGNYSKRIKYSKKITIIFPSKCIPIYDWTKIISVFGASYELKINFNKAIKDESSKKLFLSRDDFTYQDFGEEWFLYLNKISCAKVKDFRDALVYNQIGMNKINRTKISVTYEINNRL